MELTYSRFGRYFSNQKYLHRFMLHLFENQLSLYFSIMKLKIIMVMRKFVLLLNKLNHDQGWPKWIAWVLQTQEDNCFEKRMIKYTATTLYRPFEQIVLKMKLCVPIHTFMYLWASNIFPGSVHLFCSSIISKLIVVIYKSLTDTWMQKLGRAVSFLGIHKSDLLYSVDCYWSKLRTVLPDIYFRVAAVSPEKEFKLGGEFGEFSAWGETGFHIRSL